MMSDTHELHFCRRMWPTMTWTQESPTHDITGKMSRRVGPGLETVDVLCEQRTANSWVVSVRIFYCEDMAQTTRSASHTSDKIYDSLRCALAQIDRMSQTFSLKPLLEAGITDDLVLVG